MSNLKLPNITDFDSASEYWKKHSSRSRSSSSSSSSSIKIAYQTWLRKNTPATHKDRPSFSIIHHNTTIITYFPRAIVLSTNYHSRTTADRMRRMTPYGIHAACRSYTIEINGTALNGCMVLINDPQCTDSDGWTIVANETY